MALAWSRRTYVNGVSRMIMILSASALDLMDHNRHPASRRFRFPSADTAKALLVRTPVGSGFHEPSLGEAPGLAFRVVIPREALAMPVWTGLQE
ncbi:hypothetical protein DND47_09475 [Pseudomonas syringae pv. syringae]|nr:hypothetical protein DND47_09475 [Pseudomonas syringae pv. syringae]